MEQRFSPDLVILRKVCYVCHRTVCTNCRDRIIQLFPTPDELEKAIQQSKKEERKRLEKKRIGKADVKSAILGEEEDESETLYLKLASGADAFVKKIVAFNIHNTLNQHSLDKKAVASGITRAEPLKACKDCVSSCVEQVLRSTNKLDPHQAESTKAILGALEEAVSLRTKIATNVAQLDGLSRTLYFEAATLTLAQQDLLYEDADQVAEKINLDIQRSMALITYASSPHTPRQPNPSLDSVFLKNLRLYMTQALRVTKPKFMSALQRVEDAKNAPPPSLAIPNTSQGKDSKDTPSGNSFTAPTVRRNKRAFAVMLYKLKRMPLPYYCALINSEEARKLLSNPSIPPHQILLLGPGGPVYGPPPPSPPSSPLQTPPPQPFDIPGFAPLSIGAGISVRSASSPPAVPTSTAAANKPSTLSPSSPDIVKSTASPTPSLHDFLSDALIPHGVSSPVNGDRRQSSSYLPLFSGHGSIESQRPASSGKRLSNLQLANSAPLPAANSGGVSASPLSDAFLSASNAPPTIILPSKPFPAAVKAFRRIDFVETNFFNNDNETGSRRGENTHSSGPLPSPPASIRGGANSPAAVSTNPFAAEAETVATPIRPAPLLKVLEPSFIPLQSPSSSTISPRRATAAATGGVMFKPANGQHDSRLSSHPPPAVPAQMANLFLSDEEQALARIAELEQQQDDDDHQSSSELQHRSIDTNPFSMAGSMPHMNTTGVRPTTLRVNAPSANSSSSRLPGPVRILGGVPIGNVNAPRAAALTTLQNLDELLEGAEDSQLSKYGGIFDHMQSSTRRMFQRTNSIASLNNDTNSLMSPSSGMNGSSNFANVSPVSVGGRQVLRRTNTGRTSADYTPIFAAAGANKENQAAQYLNGFSDSDD